MANVKMRAPEGMNSATIEGHEYTIPSTGKSKGVITMLSETHRETLERHGFKEVVDQETSPAELSETIEGWDADDKAEAVEFIEERGGTADETMSIKKLKKAAREVAGLED